MGTRGYFAFRYKGKYYVFYNQYDSYPDGLGAALVKQLNEENIAKWKEILEKLPEKEEAENEVYTKEECRRYLLLVAQEVLGELNSQSLSPALTLEILQSSKDFDEWCE